MAGFTVERVGEGVLVTFEPEGSLWFDRSHDAVSLGSALVMVASLGADSLDDTTGLLKDAPPEDRGGA